MEILKDMRKLRFWCAFFAGFMIGGWAGNPAVMKYSMNPEAIDWGRLSCYTYPVLPTAAILAGFLILAAWLLMTKRGRRLIRTNPLPSDQLVGWTMVISTIVFYLISMVGNPMRFVWF